MTQMGRINDTNVVLFIVNPRTFKYTVSNKCKVEKKHVCAIYSSSKRNKVAGTFFLENYTSFFPILRQVPEGEV